MFAFPILLLRIHATSPSIRQKLEDPHFSSLTNRTHTHSPATTWLCDQILISHQHTRHHRIYCLSFFIFSLLFCRLIIHLLIFEYFWTIWSFLAIKAMKRGFVIYYEFVDHCCLALENHTCVVTCDDQHYCAYCINMARTPPGPEEKGVLVLFRSNMELNVFL